MTADNQDSSSAAFREWASTKDFYDITCPYPFTAYARQEMQIAWIAWEASRKRVQDNDIEGTSEAMARMFYEVVNNDAATRTPWTYLDPGEWNKWRRAVNLAKKQVTGGLVK